MKIKTREHFRGHKYKRKEFNEIFRILNNNNKDVVVLKGLRRVGKTTILEQIYEEFDGKTLFLEMEDNDNSNALYEYLKNIYKIYNLIIIDEISVLKNILNDFMYFKDIITESGCKLIISGSQSLTLNKISNNGLFGRCIVYNLHPSDFIDYYNITGNNWEMYKSNGGLFYENYNTMDVIYNIVEDIYSSIIKANVEEIFSRIRRDKVFSAVIYTLFIVSWESMEDVILISSSEEFDIYRNIFNKKDEIMDF